jgi:hypothetical protein
MNLEIIVYPKVNTGTFETMPGLSGRSARPAVSHSVSRTILWQTDGDRGRHSLHVFPVIIQ